MRFVLASASPRRREILTRLGYEFSVHASDAPESDVHGTITEMVKTLAERKGEAVEKLEKDAIIIAADTLVGINETALGKPKDPEDAFHMLRMLSGKTHQVSTGLCLINTENGKKRIASDTTFVTFKELSDEEIRAYIATGEPMDKAGSYAIQGGAEKFVQKYEGSFDNIVGFPSELFLRMIKDEQ